MARGSKTQTLSLRLDPKTRFVLEFLSRIKGQSITTLVERAIKESADRVSLGEWQDQGPTWADFWDPSEGVRTLRLLSDAHYPTTFDEDELRQFTLDNGPFFYSDRKGHQPLRHYIDVLWPKMERYMALWRDKKSADYWAASKAMKSDLLAAMVAPPEWPPKSTEPVADQSAENAGDFDVDIPF